MPEIAALFERIDRLDQIMDRLEETLHAPGRVSAAERVVRRRAELSDRLVAMTDTAAAELQVPICMVNVITDKVQVVMACSGDGGDADSQATYCQYVAGSGNPFRVDDAAANPLVRWLPASKSGEVLAYYGAPVCLDGEAVGAFCIADSHTRHWSPFETALVHRYAEQVSMMLEAA